MSIIRKFVRDVPIEGLICLDAGTGIGGMTRYLVKRRTKLVYSISNNQEHLDYAHSKCSTEELTKIRFINADMSDLNFLSAETVDVITTHMLINVVTPVKLFSIFRELTWVARKNSLLIIIDYNPLYTYQTDRSHLIEEIFKIENAIHYLGEGEPALIWYPSEYIINLLQFFYWVSECVKLLYSKTPWEKKLIKEHIDVINEMCVKVDQESIRENFLHNAVEIFNKIGDEEVIYAGSIYGIKVRKK